MKEEDGEVALVGEGDVASAVEDEQRAVVAGREGQAEADLVVAAGGKLEAEAPVARVVVEGDCGEAWSSPSKQKGRGGERAASAKLGKDSQRGEIVSIFIEGDREACRSSS